MIARTILCSLVLAMAVAGVCSAAGTPWAARMFPTVRHDFGVVAKGANVEYRFVFENPYQEDVQIASVQSTCRCTVPRATKTLLKTHETAEIVAEFNTRQFDGPKEATIKVSFDQPSRAEVQLHVQGFIRSDVVFQPGSVQFGTVPQGQASTKRIQVSYSGRKDWRVLGAVCRVPYLEARIRETGRSQDPLFPGSTQVSYDLWVTLKSDAPPGYFKEPLILQTNDSAPNSLAAQVPLAVEGLVTAPLAAYPSVLMLGRLAPKETAARNLVVRGAKPFRIVEVSLPDRRFRSNASSQAASVHIVAIHFTADAVAGKVAGKILIQTDLGTAEAAVTGDVALPPEAAKTKGP